MRCCSGFFDPAVSHAVCGGGRSVHRLLGAAWNEQLKGCGRRSLRVFLNLSFAFFLLFSGTYVRRQETLFAAGKRAILFVGCLHAVLYLVLEGIWGTGACGDGLSGSHADEHGKNIRRLFEKNRRVYVRRVVLYAVCTFKQLRLLRKQHSREIMETYSQNAKREKLHVDFLWICGGGSFCGSDLFYRSRAVFDWYERFLWYVGTPFLVLAPSTAQKSGAGGCLRLR